MIHHHISKMSYVMSPQAMHEGLQQKQHNRGDRKKRADSGQLDIDRQGARDIRYCSGRLRQQRDKAWNGCAGVPFLCWDI